MDKTGEISQKGTMLLNPNRYPRGENYSPLLPPLLPRAALNIASTTLRKVVGVDAKRNDIELGENEYYHPYSTLISKGIETFEKLHPDMQAHWKEKNEPEYMTVKKFLAVLSAPLTPQEAAALKYPSMAGKPFINALVELKLRGVNLKEFNPLVKDRLPESVRAALQAAEQASPLEHENAFVREPDLWEKLPNMMTFVEKAYESTGTNEPLSISFLIYQKLFDNRGDLRKTLEDVTIFLKYARNKDPEWMKKYIADEYSPVMPYDTLDNKPVPYKGIYGTVMERIHGLLVGEMERDSVHFASSYPDVSLNNQIGKAYHASHLAALLDQFSPESLMLLTGMEYLLYGHAHGASKALADTQVLRDLYATQKLLRKYSPGFTPLPAVLVPKTEMVG